MFKANASMAVVAEGPAEILVYKKQQFGGNVVPCVIIELFKLIDRK